MNAEDAQMIAALRQLDPAIKTGDTDSALTPSQAQQAAVLLDQIIATDPGAWDHRVAPTPPLRRRGRSNRGVLAALVALIAVAAVVVPVLIVGGDRAYASWSPIPVALSPAEGVAAAQACLGALNQVADHQVSPMLAERRGAWTYVLIRPTDKIQSSCIMPTEEITESPAGDRRRWFSSSDAELSDPASKPDEVRVDSSAVGTTKEGLFSWSEGAVGRDVVDVTFTTPRGVTVEASVDNGRYAVWWPAGENDLRSVEISEAPVIDVTLTDGTTYRLAQ